MLRTAVFLVVPAIAFYWLAQLPNNARVGEELSNCFDATEQRILLRQLALAGKAREIFDYCINNNDEASHPFKRTDVTTEDWCRGLYLNANTPIRTCMKDRGYVFTDADHPGYGACDWSRFRDPDCYRPVWEFYFVEKKRPSL